MHVNPALLYGLPQELYRKRESVPNWTLLSGGGRMVELERVCSNVYIRLYFPSLTLFFVPKNLFLISKAWQLWSQKWWGFHPIIAHPDPWSQVLTLVQLSLFPPHWSIIPRTIPPPSRARPISNLPLSGMEMWFLRLMLLSHLLLVISHFLPPPQTSLLIVWWCAWRCELGAQQPVDALRVLHPSHDDPR